MDATSREVLVGGSSAPQSTCSRTRFALCPDALWSDRDRRLEFWYLAYHTLFFLDLYLHDTVDGFAPPPPFNLDELDPSGVMPDRVYAKSELLSYLEHGRQLARTRIAALNAESASPAVRSRLEKRHVFGVAAVEHAQRAAPYGAAEPAASTGD
jgi:hypothetical protein